VFLPSFSAVLADTPLVDALGYLELLRAEAERHTRWLSHTFSGADTAICVTRGSLRPILPQNRSEFFSVCSASAAKAATEAISKALPSLPMVPEIFRQVLRDYMDTELKNHSNEAQKMEEILTHAFSDIITNSSDTTLPRHVSINMVQRRGRLMVEFGSKSTSL
jgi:hypothetical protein